MLLLAGLWMAYQAPLLPLKSTSLAGLDLTEHGDMRARATVVCVHSIFQGRESCWPIAQALARRGFNSVNLHLAPGQDYGVYVTQILTVVEHYANHGPVYLWGHSMGADLVAEAGSQGRAEAIVAAGFPVTSPARRMLLVVGAWDQLHSVPEMRAAAAALPQKPAVAVLPLSDHNQENFDPASAAVAATHFGAPDPAPYSDSYLARGLLALGVMLLTAATAPSDSRRFRILCLGVVLLTWSSDPYHTVARAVLLGLVLAQGRAHRLSWRQTVGLLGALMAGQIVVAWPNWTQEPIWLAYLPLAMLSWLPTGTLKFASDLPPFGWGLLWLAEAWRPGVLTRVVCWLPATTWRKLGRLHWQGPTRVTPAQLGLLALLLVGAGLAWWNVAQAGYWPEPDQWRMLATKVGGLVLTPLLVWVAAARRFATTAEE